METFWKLKITAIANVLGFSKFPYFLKDFTVNQRLEKTIFSHCYHLAKVQKIV